MKNIRIGNDINIVWSIFDVTGAPYELKKEMKLTLKCGNYLYEIENYTVEDNKIMFTFYGKTQTTVGTYMLTLVENDDEVGMQTVDCCKAFKLVRTSCEQTDDDTLNPQVDTLQLTSNIDFYGEIGGGSSDILNTENTWNALQYFNINPQIEGYENIHAGNIANYATGGGITIDDVVNQIGNYSVNWIVQQNFQSNPTCEGYYNIHEGNLGQYANDIISMLSNQPIYWYVQQQFGVNPLCEGNENIHAGNIAQYANVIADYIGQYSIIWSGEQNFLVNPRIGDYVNIHSGNIAEYASGGGITMNDVISQIGSHSITWDALQRFIANPQINIENVDYDNIHSGNLAEYASGLGITGITIVDVIDQIGGYSIQWGITQFFNVNPQIEGYENIHAGNLTQYTNDIFNDLGNQSISWNAQQNFESNPICAGHENIHAGNLKQFTGSTLANIWAGTQEEFEALDNKENFEFLFILPE